MLLRCDWSRFRLPSHAEKSDLWVCMCFGAVDASRCSSARKIKRIKCQRAKACWTRQGKAFIEKTSWKKPMDCQHSKRSHYLKGNTSVSVFIRDNASLCPAQIVWRVHEVWPRIGWDTAGAERRLRMALEQEQLHQNSMDFGVWSRFSIFSWMFMEVNEMHLIVFGWIWHSKKERCSWALVLFPNCVFEMAKTNNWKGKEKPSRIKEPRIQESKELVAFEWKAGVTHRESSLLKDVIWITFCWLPKKQDLDGYSNPVTVIESWRSAVILKTFYYTYSTVSG